MTDSTHQFIVILSVIVIGGVSAWCLFDCWRNWYISKMLERKEREREEIRRAQENGSSNVTALPPRRDSWNGDNTW